MLGSSCFMSKPSIAVSQGPVRVNNVRLATGSKLDHGKKVVCVARAQEDPYSVLGVPDNVSSQRIQQVYQLKLKEAKEKGDEELIQQIEAAHSQIFMQSLQQRIQGGTSKEIKYADKVQYLPWRPRFYSWTTRMIVISGVINGACLMWSLVSTLTAQTQPVIASALAAGVMNVMKQNQLFPLATSVDATDEEKKQGGKNVLRGILLAVTASLFGMFLCYSLPDYISAWMGYVMPYEFYQSQSILLTIGTTISNFLMTSFFR
eukprot:TRINITY_DN2794_c0_g2_i2.p1 TRINITY_DN2794_c0_g2~~TRINITY_DN2794_c0_g2_i2.p1  ORF type:complete len:280 (+),score=14.44 TRINITY_DN2794_c0_g2_i2:59-841(+)